MNTMVKRVRGAGMVEYAFLLVAVLLLGALTFKALGKKVNDKTVEATGALG